MLESEDLREIIAKHSKTFYFATQFLPPDKRRAIWSLYAFCRTIDDLADENRNASIEALEEWKNNLNSSQSNNQILQIFKETIEKYDIPLEYANDLIEGCKRDLTQNRYQDFAELADYCYQVASTVGLMSSHIIGFDRAHAEEVKEQAIKAGIALQLTNILRDVGEDLQRGRIYIPQKDFEACKCNISEPEQWKDSVAFKLLINLQIQRARALYSESWAALKYLHSSGKFAVGMALKSYEEILRRIEFNNYDVLTKRAYVPFKGKIALIPVVFMKLIRL